MDLTALRWFVLSTFLLPFPAAASGVFVPSDAGVPVSQAGERVLLGQEGTALTTHIQVYYQGQPTDFAWLLPVPAMPTIEPGSGELFNQLAAATQPAYQLDRFYRCRGATQQTVGPATAVPQPPELATAMGTLSPYESAILPADSQDSVLKWLTDRRYPVPAGLSAALAPYVGHGGAIVALRFQSTQAAGALQPVVLHYQGDQLSLPLRVSSPGTTQQTPLQVWVLGPSRAVPLTAAHAVLNDAQINWFTGANNYQDVITRAIAENGGRAFVTEFAGASAVARGALSGRDDLLQYPYLTRLSTVLGPADRSRDPSFGYNPGLPAVASIQQATLTYHCPGPARRQLCVEPGYAGYPDSGYFDYGYYDASGLYIDVGDWSDVDYGDVSGGTDPVWYDSGDYSGGDYGDSWGGDTGGGDTGGGDTGGGDTGGGDTGGGDDSIRAVGHLSRSLSTGYTWAVLLTPQGWKLASAAQAADQGLYSPPNMPYSLRAESLSSVGPPQLLIDNTAAIKTGLGIGRHSVPTLPPCRYYSGCSASVEGGTGRSGNAKGLIILLSGLFLMLWRARSDRHRASGGRPSST